MANRVKSVSRYTGSAWETGVPIGADAPNIDMGENAPSEYDSSSAETSKVLIETGSTNDVKVVKADTDYTAWGKFNRFRRRVSNKFADYFATANLTKSSTGVTSSGDDTHAYTTAALNNYFNTVIGYQSAADVSTVGSVASQLSSLNDNISDGIGSSSDKFRFGTDGNNNYGYIKKVEGADTFFPFKSAPEFITQTFTQHTYCSTSSYSSPAAVGGPAFNIDVSKSGYTPIGIINVKTENISTSNSNIAYHSVKLEGTTLHIGRQVGYTISGSGGGMSTQYTLRSTSASGTVSVTIQYVKN